MKSRSSIPPDNFNLEFADWSELASARLTSGAYRLTVGGKRTRFELDFRERAELTLATFSFPGEKAKTDRSVFPGQVVRIKTRGGKRAATDPSLSKLITALAGALETPPERLFFLLDLSRPELFDFARANFPAAGIAIWDDYRERSLLRTLFRHAAPRTENISRLEKSLAGDENAKANIISDGRAVVYDHAAQKFPEEPRPKKPPDKLAAKITGDALETLLAEAGVRGLTRAISPIDLSSLYIYSWRKGIAPDKLEHSCYGRPDLPAVAIDENYNWNNNPYGDRNWFAQLQMWRMLDDYLVNYANTGDDRWLAAPILAVESWAKFYKANSPARAVWADMNVGLRAMKLAYLLSLHKSGARALAADFAALCEDLAEKHLEVIITHKKSFYSNHSLIDLHGLAALCHVLKPSAAARGLDYIEKTWPGIIASQFDENGVHREHSPGYQLFLHGYLRILQRSPWFNAVGLEELIKRSEKVLSWLTLPDGRLVPAGDTDGGGTKKRRWRPTPEEIFNRSGYAVVRKIRAPDPERSSYLFFMGAANSRVHKHSDDLSLIWYDGCDILCDPGKYGYQRSTRRDYVISTRAHNTVEIDGGDSYDPGAPETNPPTGVYIKSVVKRDLVYFLNGEMKIPRFDATHKRRALFLPDRFLIVIDWLASAATRTFAAHWHFAPGAEVRNLGEGRFETTLTDGRALHCVLLADEPLRTSLVKGAEEPRPQGFISEGYRSLTPAWCVGGACEGREALLISAFFLNNPPAINFIENKSLFFNNFLYDLENDALSVI